MKNVAIIDYDAGNLDSVARAVEECKAEPVVTSSRSDIETSSCIIMPGVGSFADGMKKIVDLGLDEILYEQVIERKIPFLGICLGMQLLASEGYEGGRTKGLGWIEGKVQKLQPGSSNERIPHIGWNNVIYDKTSSLFKDVASGKDFYFVHSYHFICKNDIDILAYTLYCGKIITAINKENIYGVQFHPEKSQKLGIKLLANFLEI